MTRSLFLTVAVGLALSGASHAQPAPDEAPKTQNPPNAPFGGGLRPPDWQNLSPKERREAIRKNTLDTLRGSLQFLGFTDPKIVDAVLETAAQQEKILAPVRLQQRELVSALAANALPAAQLNALGADFLASVEEAREQRAQTIEILEQKIRFSKDARLAATLSLAGVTGDDTAFLGGIGTALFVGTANFFLGFNQTPAQIAEEKKEAQEGAEAVAEILRAAFPEPQPEAAPAPAETP